MLRGGGKAMSLPATPPYTVCEPNQDRGGGGGEKRFIRRHRRREVGTEVFLPGF